MSSPLNFSLINIPFHVFASLIFYYTCHAFFVQKSYNLVFQHYMSIRLKETVVKAGVCCNRIQTTTRKRDDVVNQPPNRHRYIIAGGFSNQLIDMFDAEDACGLILTFDL